MGGVAGVKLRTELDTSTLPVAEAGGVEEAVRGLAGHVPSAPPPPDAFRYEIARLDEPASAPVSIDEHDLPAALAGPLEAAMESAEIELPER